VHEHRPNIIEFSWNDNVPHTGVELTFTSTVGDNDARRHSREIVLLPAP
jgi:hypothetical protein